MFDISWTEFLLIGVVALVVIGPKELPGVLRTLGQWMRKVRSMAADFQNQFNEAMREAEMADLKKQVDDMAHDFKSFDPLGDVKRDVDAMGRDFETSLDGKPAVPTTPDVAPTVLTASDLPPAIPAAADVPPAATEPGTSDPAPQSDNPAAPGASLAASAPSTAEPFPIAEAAAELHDQDIAATATGPVTTGSAKPDSGGHSA